MPQSSQHEADDDDMARESRGREEFADGEEVCDASNRQSSHEIWPTPITEVACADRQRRAQRGAEYVHSPRGGDLHYCNSPPLPLPAPDPTRSMSEMAI